MLNRIALSQINFVVYNFILYFFKVCNIFKLENDITDLGLELICNEFDCFSKLIDIKVEI